MKKISILLLICSSLTVQADVFKCTDKSGKAKYQSKPCEEMAKGRQLDIKVDAVKESEGRAKMEALDQEYTQNKAKQSEAEKQALDEQSRPRTQNFLNQNANFQNQPSTDLLKQLDQSNQ